MPANIDVVLPCLNVVAALPWLLARMPPGVPASRRGRRL
jgi:hypothetical protein